MQERKPVSQTVKDFMTYNVSTLYYDSSIRDAVALFQKEKVKIFPVVEKDHRITGVITLSSLLKGILVEETIDASIAPYIIHQVVTVNEEDNLLDVRKRLDEKKVGHAIVISDDQYVCGVLDTSNIIQAYHSTSESLANSLASLIQHMQTGVLAIDTNGMIIVVNSAAEKMCNITQENSIGCHYSHIFPELHEILDPEANTSIDTPVQRMTIGEKKILISAKSLSKDSQYWGGIILLQDLTHYEHIAKELEVTKKLERTLQTVVNTAYDGLILIDNKGNIEMINDSACELVRNNNIHELIGQSVDTVFPELKLGESLKPDYQDENLQAIFIGKRRCLVKKIPIYKDDQVVGSVAIIIYRNLNKWKSVVSRLDTLEKKVSYYRAELSLLSATPFDLDDIISKNKEMERIKKLARQSAPGFSNVLLLGESGTGKELFARGIHTASNRTGKFIKINCAAIPTELWETEFFGYADGAFTGAKRGGKPGKFELAHNGTIFLDEIGDMPLPMQVKLLRVLQEREFERVGGTETIHVNVRIITATNKNLEELVLQNQFREDLYYRINVIVINIPPLRERREDIPLLSTAISRKFSHLMGLGPITITENVYKVFNSHHWPGNVRELENSIERAMNCINSDTLDVEHLPEYLIKGDSLKITLPIQTQTEEATVSEIYKNNVERAGKDAIEAALKQTGGNRTAAAKLLGISRSQFYKKMHKL